MQVDQGYIYIAYRGLRQGLCTGGRGNRLEPFDKQNIAHGCQKVGIIIYEQNTQRFQFHLDFSRKGTPATRICEIWFLTTDKHG